MSDWVKAYWPRSGESLSARTVSTSLRTRELNNSSRLAWSMSETASIAWRGKLASEHRALLYDPALVGGEGVEPGGNEGREPRWDLELAEIGDELQATIVAFLEDSLVEQASHRLDRIERDPLGAFHDAIPRGGGKARDEAVEELADDLVRERVEREGRDAAAREPESLALGPLRSRQHEEEDGVVARPLEQVVQEVDHAGIGPLQVLDDHDDRQVLGQVARRRGASPRRALLSRAPLGSAAPAAGRDGGR